MAGALVNVADVVRLDFRSDRFRRTRKLPSQSWRSPQGLLSL